MNSQHSNLPHDFITRLKQIIPASSYQKVLSSFSHKKPTTFRANTLKISARDLRNILFEKGIKLENVTWYKDAFVLKNRELRDIRDMGEYGGGLFYVQSLSSMIPPLVLDPKPGEKALDICAAPGSKTTQMAVMMGNKGEIVANDTSPIRLERLKANLRIQEVSIVRIEKQPAQSIWMKYPEYFDKVLVDVPCSMEGRFCILEPKTYSGWSTKKVKNLSKLQKWILRSAVSTTKVGGKIVYSTCTLSPEENEEVIDWILEKEKDNIIIEMINDQWLMVNGISMWKGKKYHPEISKTARILPSETMEGFFVACLRKVRSNIPQNPH